MGQDGAGLDPLWTPVHMLVGLSRQQLRTCSPESYVHGSRFVLNEFGFNTSFPCNIVILIRTFLFLWKRWDYHDRLKWGGTTSCVLLTSLSFCGQLGALPINTEK